MRSHLSKLSAILACSLALSAVAASAASSSSPAYVPDDAERARWTMHDMRSWAIAVESYKLDHGSYPAAANLEELRASVEPAYIRAAPMRDAWGRAYRYEFLDGNPYLTSAGADGRFDEGHVAKRAELTGFDGDAVWNGGPMLLRTWPYLGSD